MKIRLYGKTQRSRGQGAAAERGEAAGEMKQEFAGELCLYTEAGGVLFGFPAERLVTILSGPAVRAELSGETAPGELPVFRWNEETVPVLRLRELMGFPSGKEELHALLFRTGEGPFAVLTDRVLDTAPLPADSLRELPDVVRSPKNIFLSGVIAAGPPYELGYLLETELLLSAARARLQEQEAGL